MSAIRYAVSHEKPQGASAASLARAAEVRSASGERLTVAVVADGDDAGAAAERVIEQVFQTVQGARARQVGDALRRGLEIAGQTLQGRGARAAATAAAIWRGGLYLAHVGHTAAFHVERGEVRRLTVPGPARLGSQTATQVETGPPDGRPLARGDRLVLTSGRLTETSPEDGKPFLDPKAMPEYVSGVPPLEAARHLISIALGRDAPEDLAVAVLAMPGVARERRAGRGRRFLVPALGLLTAAAVGLALLGLLQQPQEPASDYGYAVLIEGGLQAEGEIGAVQRLEPLPAQSTITAMQDSSLGFQSTFSGGSDISATTLHLGSGSRVRLTALDRRQPESRSVASPTQIDLLLGPALLVRASGERDLRVALPEGHARLLGSGRAALAVSLDASGSEIVCLVGTCLFQPQGGEPATLFAGQLLRPSEGSPRLHEAAVYLNWDRRCAGCLSAP